MRVYTFDHPHDLNAEGATALLGGKGASLWTMARGMGLPVPPGLTIPTTEQAVFDREGLTDALMAEVLSTLETIGAPLGRRFGDPERPLLVSVRSGAATSMPGMMDTILNVGITPNNVGRIAALHDDARFASETLARFLRQFGATALGLELDHDTPDEAVRAAVEAALPAGALNEPVLLLRKSIEAVFASWNGDRARTYRRIGGLDNSAGTAVNIQAMVFGNLDDQSGTGVVFSRDPSTGQPGAVGDYLPRAQGEDVVAGTANTGDHGLLAQRHPDLHAALDKMLARLEQHYQDMVDVEYTVEAGKLFILQARRGKRSPEANAQIAVDLANDPAFQLDRAGAVRMAAGEHAATGHADRGTVLTTGLGASAGLATGVVVMSADEAVELSETQPVILVRRETSPSDIHGMSVATGILTTLGGRMSHAAVVARDWALPAVVGAEEITIDENGFSVGQQQITRGQTISIDGQTGAVFLGTPESHMTKAAAFQELENWEAELTASV